MAVIEFRKEGYAPFIPSHNPRAPWRLTVERAQTLGLSAGGRAYVYDRGYELRRWVLVFEDLGEADRAGLESWFRGVARGMLEPFTLCDADGVEHTVRFARPALDLSEIRRGRWTAEVELLEEL